jgi:hypothetical protein
VVVNTDEKPSGIVPLENLKVRRIEADAIANGNAKKYYFKIVSPENQVAREDGDTTDEGRMSIDVDSINGKRQKSLIKAAKTSSDGRIVEGAFDSG